MTNLDNTPGAHSIVETPKGRVELPPALALAALAHDARVNFKQAALSLAKEKGVQTKPPTSPQSI